MLTAAFVIAGFALGRGGLGVIDIDPKSDAVEVLAIVALVVILFRDGLEVELEMLQSAWRVPLRKLVLAMPVTCVLVATVTKLVTDLDWTEAFLLGALLSPTDPVLTSNVVTNRRVPQRIRHSLNLESGLNDGLALPAVLAFAAALEVGKDDFVWWHFVLQDVTLGFTIGIAAGAAASRLVPRRAKGPYGLAIAFGTYELAHLVHGNGLIAVFVGAITLGILRRDVLESLEARSERVIGVVKY